MSFFYRKSLSTGSHMSTIHNSEAKKRIRQGKTIRMWTIRECFFNLRINNYHYTGKIFYEQCKYCGAEHRREELKKLPESWILIDLAAQAADRLQDTTRGIKKLINTLQRGG